MQFKALLQPAITKLSEPATVAQGHDEIEDLLRTSIMISEQERINAVIYHINEMFTNSETGSMK